jgi:hypothetical protein
VIRRSDLLFYTPIVCNTLLLDDFCLPCPSGAFCPGGGRMWPFPGYWSYSEYSIPVRCVYPLACPGAVTYAAANAQPGSGALLSSEDANAVNAGLVFSGTLNPDGSRNTRICANGYSGDLM